MKKRLVSLLLVVVMALGLMACGSTTEEGTDAEVKDTFTYSLGNRWKSDETINKIQYWEFENGLNNKLSFNYDNCLKILKFRDILEVEESTSYGNPRLYKLKDGFSNQLSRINKNSKAKLKERALISCLLIF